MLRVVSGIPEKPILTWVYGKADSFFDYRVEESWFEDNIIKQELRDVDKIVKIDGLLLTTETGRRIPPNWLSQGSKQFITMTRKPKKFYNAIHYGANLYEYFYKWASERNTDVNMLINSPLCIGKNMKGVFINNNSLFNSGEELCDLILSWREGILYEKDENGNVFYERAERRGDMGALVGLGTRVKLNI